MIHRASSLKQVAEHSDSLADFGQHLRDWLHELRRFSARAQAAAAIAEEPRLLRNKFSEGEIADAWLAAYAEYLAGKLGIPVPNWTFESSRTLTEPAFDEGTANPALRRLALAGSPLAFKRRNIFTPHVDLPISIRAGRPRKTAEEKRLNNAERQKRFRAARNAELANLRKQQRAHVRFNKR